ncbi:MAG: hypothetical protein IT428_00375 [Planctomycetaceae bacterium]|nr:hypothetical protein [Planctomycetaceae bacterium]
MDRGTCHRAPDFRGKAEFTAGLKLAYYGGAIVAESLLDAKARLPLEEADRLFDREMLLHVKMLGVLSAPLGSPEDAADFLKLALDYETRKAELQLEREKFEHQRAQDIRTHDLEMLQLRSIRGEDDLPSASHAGASIEKPVHATSRCPLNTHESAA